MENYFIYQTGDFEYFECSDTVVPVSVTVTVED